MIQYRGSAEHFNRTAFGRRAVAGWLLCEEGNFAVITRLFSGLSWVKRCTFLHKARCFTGLNIRAPFVLQGLTFGSFLSDFVEYFRKNFYGIRRMAIASQRFVTSRKILEVRGCYAVYSNRRGVRICRYATREYRQNDCESPVAIVF